MPGSWSSGAVPVGAHAASLSLVSAAACKNAVAVCGLAGAGPAPCHSSTCMHALPTLLAFSPRNLAREQVMLWHTALCTCQLQMSTFWHAHTAHALPLGPGGAGQDMLWACTALKTSTASLQRYLITLSSSQSMHAVK
jgi:hypothetical protein